MCEVTELFPDLRNKNRCLSDLKQAQAVMLRLLRIVDFLCKKHNIPYWLEGGTLLGAYRHKGFIPWDDDIDIGMEREAYNKFCCISGNVLPKDIFCQSITSDYNYINLATPLKVRHRNTLFCEPGDQYFDMKEQGVFLDIFPFDRVSEENTLYKKARKKINFLQKIARAQRAAHPKLQWYLWRLLSVAYSSQEIPKLIDQEISRVQQLRGQSDHLSYGVETGIKNIGLKYDDIFPLSSTEFEGLLFPAPQNIEQYLQKKYGNYNKLPDERERKPQHMQGFRLFA